LVGLRVEARRGPLRADRFEVHMHVLKDKVGIAAELSSTTPLAPAGLGGASWSG
jgi:hypothetical protein